MVDDSQAAWVHSGDSRLYQYTMGRLTQRTHDHSLIQILYEKGQVAEKETRRHPVRSVLLQSLGGPEYLPVAARQLEGSVPRTSSSSAPTASGRPSARRTCSTWRGARRRTASGRRRS